MDASKTMVSPASQRTSAPTAPASRQQATPVAQRLGNAGLQRLLQARRLQAKLTVSDPNDVYEQEADRVADSVMRMPEPAAAVAGATAPLVQRACSGCEEQMQRQAMPMEEEMMQMSSESSQTPHVDAATEASIGALAGRGSALPDPVRSFMEPRFNTDFSAVRVHTDADAQSLARSVQAQAFTVGNNVVFGSGHYAPETDSGKRLLAHELTHVIQQSGGG